MHNNILLSGLVAGTLIYIIVAISRIRNDFILRTKLWSNREEAAYCNVEDLRRGYGCEVHGHDCPRLFDHSTWQEWENASDRCFDNFWHRHIGAAMGWVDWL